jgi:cytidylate kinase
MTVVTLSWQLGVDGERIGELLGDRLGLPVVNRQIVRAIMRGLHMRAAAANATERTVPTWGTEAGAGLSEWFGVAELRAVLGQTDQVHRTTESVLHEAARQPCVVVGRGGFAALADHPGARHVRLIAPAEWRIERVAAERAVSRTQARRLVAADDRMRRSYIGRHYARRLDDPSNFHLMITASRFTDGELVEVIVAGLPAGTASSDDVTAIGA